MSETDTEMLKPVISGGGKCTTDSNCGSSGVCYNGHCKCSNNDYTGPYCLVRFYLMRCLHSP